MTQTRNQIFVRLAVTTALATTALAGCTGNPAPTSAMSAAKAEVALKKGNGDKAVQHAEAAVLAAPRDAYTRTLLGNAYLEAGRTVSAAQSFQDAIALGDTSPRTVISLALAQTGMGDRYGAIATLEKWEASLDAADFGLAIALAGQPERGVHVMGNAIRNGDNTPKMRQNLAYAYALAGQWQAARLMAAEDVPADQVGQRMSEWGATARPEQFQQRVANLLGVDLVADPGQPTMLALSNSPTVEMLAAETTEDGPSADAGTGFALASELPSVGAAPVAYDSGDAALADAGLDADAARFASSEVVQAAPVQTKPAPRAAQSQPARAATAPRSSARLTLAKGDYNIQLGSYFSMSDAQAAWSRFQAKYPELAGSERQITKARVNGKIYYRVAAAGMAKTSARSMCSVVKGKGGGCIAYAASNPLPGALNENVRVAAR